MPRYQHNSPSRVSRLQKPQFTFITVLYLVVLAGASPAVAEWDAERIADERKVFASWPDWSASTPPEDNPEVVNEVQLALNALVGKRYAVPWSASDTRVFLSDASDEKPWSKECDTALVEWATGEIRFRAEFCGTPLLYGEYHLWFEFSPRHPLHQWDDHSVADIFGLPESTTVEISAKNGIEEFAFDKPTPQEWILKCRGYRSGSFVGVSINSIVPAGPARSPKSDRWFEDYREARNHRVIPLDNAMTACSRREFLVSASAGCMDIKRYSVVPETDAIPLVKGVRDSLLAFQVAPLHPYLKFSSYPRFSASNCVVRVGAESPRRMSPDDVVYCAWTYGKWDVLLSGILAGPNPRRYLFICPNNDTQPIPSDPWEYVDSAFGDLLSPRYFDRQHLASSGNVGCPTFSVNLPDPQISKDTPRAIRRITGVVEGRTIALEFDLLPSEPESLENKKFAEFLRAWDTNQQQDHGAE